MASWAGNTLLGGVVQVGCGQGLGKSPGAGREGKREVGFFPGPQEPSRAPCCLWPGQICLSKARRYHEWGMKQVAAMVRRLRGTRRRTQG